MTFKIYLDRIAAVAGDVLRASKHQKEPLKSSSPVGYATHLLGSILAGALLIRRGLLKSCDLIEPPAGHASKLAGISERRIITEKREE